MGERTHHISGRLQLKLEHIRKQPQRAQEVAMAICHIRGVASVNTNISTGSLLIRYDMLAVEGDVILNAMKEAGLLAPANAVGAPWQSPSSPVADKDIDVAAGGFIERTTAAPCDASF